MKYACSVCEPRGMNYPPLCKVYFHGMYLIFKFTEGNPWVYLINIVLDGISLFFNVVYYFYPKLWLFPPLWDWG